ncbi:solute carrier family 25 member 48-like isoform X2 [Penaeus indicus]|uniref:solute carrier family 25 member 48-like isoform X2 n=1 Tax=Penaeus indicus TaxID=29960 RepID=UPI00300C5C19
MGFPLLSTGTLNALFFGVYGNTVRILSEGRDRPSFTDIFLAGCAGGVAQLVVACPVDLIKIKMQMQTGSSEGIWGKHFESHYRGPTSCLLDLYRKGGIRACYTGLNSMAIRDVIASAAYVVLYEWMVDRNPSPATLPILWAGGMAGVISWAMIIPLDVVKSRIQGDNPSNPQYKNARDCFVKSYKAEGLKVFTRGFWMMSLRAFPTNGAIFLGYVSSLNLLKRISGERQESETVVVAA